MITTPELDTDGSRPNTVRDVEIQTEKADWQSDPKNPWNWPAQKKIVNVVMLAFASLLV
jgi:hypothetical protein